MIVLACVVVAMAAAAPPSDLPPPPAPLGDPAPPGAEPPPPPAPPVDVDEPHAAAPAPAPLPKKTVPEPDATAKPAAPDGKLDPFVIGALQIGLPCAIAVASIPCAFASIYLPCSSCFICLLPAANGYLATMIGDRFGRSRAPAIWPVVASYAAATFAVIGVGALYIITLGGIGGGGAFGGNSPTFYGAAAVTAGLAGVSALAVPLSYALTSEPKHLDDDGDGMPGWFSPGHPENAPKHRSPTTGPLKASAATSLATGLTVAMAF